MKTTVLLCIALMVSSLDAVSAQDPCSNQCRNGAICVPGEASFADHPSLDGPLEIHTETNINGFHCQCQPGWTGVRCDTVYESCSAEHTCYNGGECIPGLIDEYGNEQLFCDCSRALDSNGNMYVGKYCEKSAYEFCSDGSFCVNGGECNPNNPTEGDACNCLEGYGGAHCQYKKGTVPDCDLDCQNGATCELGLPSAEEVAQVSHFWDTPEGQNDFKRCVCPDGFDGPLCDKVKSECGDHHCFHGSTCVEYRDGISGEITHGCDCSTANTDLASYAGRWCQYEATSYCAKSQGINGNLFCVNGGSCQQPAVQGCSCPAGFQGFACEFAVNATIISTEPESQAPFTGDDSLNVHLETKPVPTQSPFTGDDSLNVHLETKPVPTQSPITGDDSLNIHLETKPVPTQHPNNLDDPHYFATCADSICQNGGTCRKGTKDFGDLKGIVEKVEHLNATSSSNFDHCVCPIGFIGLYCEHAVEICPTGQHVCLHGSECVTNDEAHTCDCSTTDDEETAFAGAHCEHKATEICTTDNSPGKPLSFCVNYGTCKDFVSSSEPHPGCNCMDGWEGPHCEIEISRGKQITIPEVETDVGGSERSSGLEIFLLLLCIGLLTTIFYFIVNMIRSERQEKLSVLESMSFFSRDNSEADGPNLAPHRDDVSDPFPVRFKSSSSDPFVAAIASSAPSDSTRRVGRKPAKPSDDVYEDGDYPGGPGLLHQVDVC